jgi:hypothetical protein
MKPIISPWLIYFASRVDALHIFFIILAVIFGAIAVIAFMEGDDEGEPFKYKSIITKFLIGCVLMAIVTVMTPNTETIYTMAVVNEITPDNIQTIGKTGKGVVDYIIDQIDKIVNDNKNGDTEENEK